MTASAVPVPAKLTAASLAAALDARADPERAAQTQRFFRTGPGEYGEGDVFAGLPVPVTRAVATSYRGLPLVEAVALLESPVHEHRLAALLVLVDDATRALRRPGSSAVVPLHEAYLDAVHRGRVNSWDLVDTSAERLAGDPWRLGLRSPRGIDELVRSASLWERRTAMVSTFSWIKQGEAEPTLRLAEILLDDREDLMHKAAGWMLREVGKRVSREALTGFLDRHAGAMPRTMLSYATEHLDAAQRARYRAVARR